jgi:hypothetical protein
MWPIRQLTKLDSISLLLFQTRCRGCGQDSKYHHPFSSDLSWSGTGLINEIAYPLLLLGSTRSKRTAGWNPRTGSRSRSRSGSGCTLYSTWTGDGRQWTFCHAEYE